MIKVFMKKLFALGKRFSPRANPYKEDHHGNGKKPV